MVLKGLLKLNIQEILTWREKNKNYIAIIFLSCYIKSRPQEITYSLKKDFKKSY